MATNSESGPTAVTTGSSGSGSAYVTPTEVALHKVAAVTVPQGKHIALAYSGGLLRCLPVSPVLRPDHTGRRLYPRFR
jgi:hypothetical protein